MGSGHIGIILIIISVSLMIIPAYAASNIVIYEVEPNPPGQDAGNEWVRLFNPFDYSVDLSGWEIKSTIGKKNTYTLSETIEPCEIIKITFPTQFIDNEIESLVLYDNEGKVVDVTPQITDKSYTTYTWKNPNIKLDCSSPTPVKQEPVYEEQIVQEPVMGFYENSLYDFSFEAPTNWQYQESVILEGITYPVILYPKEFSLQNADDANLLDLSTAMMGLTFQIESPLLSVQFKNIPKSEVPNLNDKSVKDYVERELRTLFPDAKMYSSSIEGDSWGWTVKNEYAVTVDFGLGQGLPYLAEDTTYVFKDREAYTISYGTIERYFDSYYDVYAHAHDTLVIKGVVVPEFQEIALMVLGGSIALVIVFARKFTRFVSKSENS